MIVFCVNNHSINCSIMIIVHNLQLLIVHNQQNQPAQAILRMCLEVSAGAQRSNAADVVSTP